MPLISIIVPVYNAESTLIRCLNSLLKQSFEDFELLVVNDGSTDNSLKILRDYERIDDRIVIINKLNGGVSSARNAGLEVVKGEWVAFCDSDDYVEPEWLENFLAVGIDTDLTQQGIIYEHDDMSSTVFCMQNDFGDTLQSKRNLIVYLMSNAVYGYLFTKLFKNSIIQNHNIRFNTTSHFREDEEFFSQYLLYIESWQSNDTAAYHYILPDRKKSYKGNSYQSLIPIFKYLDTIFDGQYPSAIADIHANNIKDMITYKCCTNQTPTKYECELYKRLRQSQSSLIDRTIVSNLIINTHKNSLIRFIIKILHSLKTNIKKNS